VAGPPPPPVLALVGPTASGKSALALDLAPLLRGEIVSLDSRQVYRGMDIGTAKPTREERRSVPHHGLDLIDPSERYSAGRFARDARDWMAGIRSRGHLPILAGGTGFFLEVLLSPIFREPPMDPGVRGRLAQLLSAMDREELLRWVAALDPEGVAAAGDGGRHRLQRRLEVALLTGYPLGWWHRLGETEGDAVPARVVALEAAPSWLDERIETRVRAMVKAGFIAEVEGLLAQGFAPSDPGMTGTGYREVVRHLAGELDGEALVQEITRATRQYARRQRTWFRHRLPADTLRLQADAPRAELVQRILAFWRGGGG
jgi:tRNA dimethylallyltransferase